MKTLKYPILQSPIILTGHRFAGYYKWAFNSFIMQNLLEDVIQSGSPEQITKYVEKYLPNDSANLQRIYYELNRYKPPKGAGSQQTENIKQIRKQAKQDPNETPLEASIRKSKSVVTFYREKGIHANEEDFENGLVIAEKEKKKFLKPLQINPISTFLKKGKVDQLCHKYQINKQFYENPPDGFDLGQAGFDPEMCQFIQKRKKLLKIIEQKRANQVLESSKSKKYDSVQSKIKRLNSGPINWAPSSILSLGIDCISKELVKQETKAIMEQCKEFRKIKLKDIGENVFIELKRRIDQQENIDIDAALKTKAKNSVISQKLQRYKLPYMSYLKQKEEKRSMSVYKKELLKDQIKMRGIVDFQK